jgi:glycosyltransferase involved in cell wall biosynthesis
MASAMRLLYLSPVLPATTGNGLAMRAGMVLRVLAEQHDVSLLVVSLYPSPAAALPAVIAERCRQVAVVAPGSDRPRPSPSGHHPLPRWLGRARRVRRVGAVLRDEPFDVVHVFRLATLPFARPWLDAPGHPPKRHLDLDDLESRTHRRLAALYRSNGDEARARSEEAEADRSRTLEAEVLRGFDRVYVCSEADEAELSGRGPAQLRVLPNALPVPGPLPPRGEGGPFTFLFVGTLGYYPNEDAARYFCTEVVPRIRRAARGDFRVVIVGTGAPPTIRRLAALPGVLVIGAVPDVAPWYRDADAVVVPIRAGGGTRIKVLEAFSFRRPVVSTSVGIEGIAAQPEQHALVADTPATFAAQCVRLMTDRHLADALAERAFSLFSRAYTTEVVARILAARS